MSGTAGGHVNTTVESDRDAECPQHMTCSRDILDVRQEPFLEPEGFDPPTSRISIDVS